jgi:membrane protease YdiL (CAAX protease family)
MFCFIFILVYPSTLYLVYSGLYLIGSWLLSEKTLNAASDRYDFIVPLASLMGALGLVLGVCDAAIHTLTAAFAWPRWFGWPTYLSLGIAIVVSVSVGVAFYYIETIAARTWLKLRMRNDPRANHRMFGDTKRIVRQGQKLPIGLLLVCILGESLLEEVLWRGYLLSYAIDILNIPIQYAVIISSFAFGINHITYGLANVISKTLFGVILSIMYLASDSLLPPILCHQVFNLMVFKIRIEWKS